MVKKYQHIQCWSCFIGVIRNKKKSRVNEQPLIKYDQVNYSHYCGYIGWFIQFTVLKLSRIKKCFFYTSSFMIESMFNTLPCCKVSSRRCGTIERLPFCSNIRKTIRHMKLNAVVFFNVPKYNPRSII